MCSSDLDAYKVSGRLVYYCTQHDKTLGELSLEELKAVSPVFEQDVYGAIALETCVGQRNSYGGPAVAETTRQLAAVRKFIAEREDEHEKA